MSEDRSPTPVFELRVRTENAGLLGEALAHLPGPPACMLGDYDGTTCTVRVHGDPRALKLAIDEQGYGAVVSQQLVQPGALPHVRAAPPVPERRHKP